MNEYSQIEIDVIQRFVDAYRLAPEILNVSEGFVDPSLNLEEYASVEVLVQRGLFEKKTSHRIGFPNFFRPSEHFTDLGQLVREGKIVLR